MSHIVEIGQKGPVTNKIVSMTLCGGTKNETENCELPFKVKKKQVTWCQNLVQVREVSPWIKTGNRPTKSFDKDKMRGINFLCGQLEKASISEELKKCTMRENDDNLKPTEHGKRFSEVFEQVDQTRYPMSSTPLRGHDVGEVYSCPFREWLV